MMSAKTGVYVLEKGEALQDLVQSNPADGASPLNLLCSAAQTLASRKKQPPGP